MVVGRRWIVWGAVNTALLLSYFHRAAPAVIGDRLMVEFEVGATVLGALAATYFYVYMAMAIPTGVLADTLGPRKTVSAGCLVSALGALLFAVAPNLWIAFSGRFLIGLGTAVAFICVLKIVAAWFRPNEFATLAGLGAIVSTAGSGIAATPLAAAAEAYGWRAALGASAAASLGVAALVWWLVRDRPPSLRDEPHHGSAPLTIGQAKLIWRNRQTWVCFWSHFGWFGTYVAFVGLWGVPYLMHVHGFDRFSAANLMIGASAAYTAGALLLGLASDRWLRMRKPPMIVAGVVFLTSWLVLVAWPGGRPPLQLTIGAILLACAAASANLLALTLSKESNPPELVGLAMAASNGGILCTALLQQLIGASLDFGWGGELLEGARIYDPLAYQLGFAAFVVCGLISLGAALLARETRCENTWGS